MPVWKYRSIEDVPPPPSHPPGDPRNFADAIEISGLCFGLRPWRFPPRVHKNRSQEEANRRRRDWERDS